jgi:hypothetical protein
MAGDAMKTALIVYYTFTGEAKRAVDIAATQLRANGFEVRLARVDFADPALRLKRPESPGKVKHWVQAAESGKSYPIVIEPADALARPADLICLFSNTWQHHPSVPIRSLLADPSWRQAIHGKRFAVYIVCRRSWTNNLEIVKRESEQAGGRFIGGEHFEHSGGNAGSMIRTVSYIMGSGGKVARFLGIRLPLPEYGLSEAALKRVVSFTKIVAAAV